MTEPGWYIDEDEPEVARWFDGTRWSSYTLRIQDWHGAGPPPPPEGSGLPSLGGWSAGDAPSGSAPLWVPPQHPTTAPPRVEPATRAPIPQTAAAPKPAAPKVAPRPPRRPHQTRQKREGPSTLRSIWSDIRREVQVAAVAFAVAVALLVGWKVVHSDDRDPFAGQTFGTDWIAADGNQYRITIAPGTKVTRHGSGGDCIEKATGEHANVPFDVRITNLGKARAPLPDVEIGSNIHADGNPDLLAATFESARKDGVELSPRLKGAPCGRAYRTGGSDRTIKPGGHVDYEGMIGGVRTPTPPGIVLIVRYVVEGETQDLVAPFSITSP